MAEQTEHQRCPFRVDLVGSAVERCPFLGQLARDHGQAFARDAAQCASKAKGPIFCEPTRDYHATFSLFHGARGVVPLVEKKRCPFDHGQTSASPPEAQISKQQLSQTSTSALTSCPKQLSKDSARSLLQSAGPGVPFASLSLSAFNFLPGPDEFIRRRRKRKHERRQRDLEKARQQQSSQNSTQNSAQQSGLEKWRTHPIVGGLIPLNAAGKYVCPPLVMAGRAAVAQLRTTKALRPRALPIKLLGVGGHCLAANIPCGMIREHTEKFSPAWILIVHATVPYFGFMRKGVGMPKWAILITIASAIAGQAIGARLEKKRIVWTQKCTEQTQLLPTEVSAPGHDRESKCPLIRTCKEIDQCDKMQQYASGDNMVLSN